VPRTGLEAALEGLTRLTSLVLTFEYIPLDDSDDNGNTGRLTMLRCEGCSCSLFCLLLSLGCYEPKQRGHHKGSHLPT